MIEEKGAQRAGAIPEDCSEQTKRRVRQHIARRLRFARGALDVGCGACGLDRFLAEQNSQGVVGVSISDGNFPGNEALGEWVGRRKADPPRAAPPFGAGNAAQGRACPQGRDGQ